MPHPPWTAIRELYDDDEGGGGDEPELRRQLRAARLAEKHAKMKAALAEKQVGGREGPRAAAARPAGKAPATLAPGVYDLRTAPQQL